MAGHGVGSHLGTLRVGSEVSKFVIESFSVGSRAVLSTMGLPIKVLAAAGSKSFIASF